MAERSSIHTFATRYLLALLVTILLISTPSFAQDSQDSQIFISGFNAYQKKDYKTAVDKMSQVLQKYPDTQLRDMALFWLSRSHFKAGNQQDAARYMAQFYKEYPDSPLKGTVEDELAALATAYAKEAKKKPAPVSADAERAAKEKAETEAAQQAKAEKDAREKAEQERVAAEKLAREKAESERIFAENTLAEQKRLAIEKEALERVAREKAERERIAAEVEAQKKAEIDRIAREKAEADRIAKEKAQEEQNRLAAEKAALEKAAAEKAYAERVAAEKAALEKAEAERTAKEKAEEERIAVLKAEAEQKRLAAEKAAIEKAKAEQERQTSLKAESERLAMEKKIAEEKAAAEKKAVAEEKRVAAKNNGKKKKSDRRQDPARDKTIAERKPVAPGGGISAKTPQPPVTTQLLNLEVGQFADVEFNISTAGRTFQVGRRITLPFEVINRGNGNDSFYLESGFPPEYGVQFFADGKPDTPINLTSQLAPMEKFKATMALTIPRTVIDGQRISYPVKPTSQFTREVSQSRQITFTTSAPLLRAVINTDRKEIAPGAKATYRIVLLNIGSAPAEGVVLRLNYPPLYEPVDFIKAGFKQEMKASLVMDGLKLDSGGSRELAVTFQLKDEAIARQELFIRGDLINNELETRDSFVSAVAQVEGISGVTARTTAERLVVIPGQTVAIPLIVVNTGNQRDDFTIKPNLPANLTYTVYQDINRDGIHQSNEPIINHVGPLAPKEEAYVVLEVKTKASENDGESTPLSVAFEAESNKKVGATVNVKIAYSRPVVELAMTGRGGRLRPGEVATFDLTCTNRGSSIAKVVELQTILPEALELVASDPVVVRGKGGEYGWKFEELGAGEKKGARVSIRVKSGVVVGTNLQVKNLLSYQDQLGNSY